MKKEEWIATRFEFMDERKFQFDDIQREWLKDMFESAWEWGRLQGDRECYERALESKKLT